MPDQNPNRHAQAKPPPGFRSFFVLSLALLLIFWGATIWLAGWHGGDADPEEAGRAELRAKTLAELRDDNARKLNSYAWVDRAEGRVQIPIAEAMRLVLPEINGSRPRAAYPVATPPPVATPTAPPAPSSSAPPAPATS